MTSDQQYTNIPLMSTFLKHFNRAYLGPAPPNDGVAPESLPDGVEELVPVEVQTQMRELFVKYFDTASKTLVKGQLVKHHVGWADTRNFSSRTSATTTRTSSRVRSSKTASRHTSA